MATSLALVFCDGCEHYGSSNITSKYTNSSFASISVNGKRNGTQGLSLGSVSKTLRPLDNLTLGFAYRVDLSSTAIFGGTIYTLKAVNTSRALSTLFALFLLADGTLALYAGGVNLMANPKTFVMVNGSWAYIEVSIQSSASTNAMIDAELRVNGNVLATATGGNSNVPIASLLSGDAKGDYHTWGSGVSGTGGATYMRDMYITEQSGSGTNSYYGDVLIKAIYPRQDVHIDMATTGGSVSYTQVNEHPPDDDATYVSSATVGDYDTFYFDTVASFVGTIKAVQFLLYMRKDNEGARVVKHIAGDDAYEDAAQYLNDSYFYHHVPWDVEPESGLAWTPAIINAQKFGAKVTA